MTSATQNISDQLVATVDVSIVIVNYNVRYFLEQCLQSVAAAIEGLSAEVFVVDNNSMDSSLSMLAEFPWVRLIENDVNVGFAKANNQAIALARGRYILLLNPDTLLGEAGLHQCLAYADQHIDVGAIGARMIDGRGNFLPESKRGFPTAWVSFTKMSGLSRLAPKSERLNRYYLGHQPEHETCDVDVLPGAFMWLRQSVLTKVGGGLDEDYFMYGEDIDLSYLIQKAGYRNVYLPAVTLLHYKGESTRKRSLRYVKTFYNAMIIFAEKHVVGPHSSTHQWTLRLAIYARATIALVANAIAMAALALVDALTLAGLLFAIKALWAVYYFNDAGYYTNQFDAVNVPLYVMLWIIGLKTFGAYDRPYRIIPAARGLAGGTLLVLIAYALLPVEYRSSRAIILLTSVASIVSLGLIRLAWSILRPGSVSFGQSTEGKNRRLAIIGDSAEANRCLSLFAKAGLAREYVGRISTDTSSDNAIGSHLELEKIHAEYAIDELVVCLQNFEHADFLKLLQTFGNDIEIRTLAVNAEAIVGSPSPNSPGQTYHLSQRVALAAPHVQRSKRLLDLGLAVTILIFWPIVFFAQQPLGLVRNACHILLRRLTWVGYNHAALPGAGLPSLSPCVLPLTHQTHKANELYARFYRTGEDAKVIQQQWRKLGQRPTSVAKVATAKWPLQTSLN